MQQHPEPLVVSPSVTDLFSVRLLPTPLTFLPCPLQVNTAFLKLADLFRNGHNFIRVCILRVVRSCESVLSSVVNAEAVIQRLSSVLESTHVSARALTLRTLGSMARLITRNYSFQEKLKGLLDSPHRVEVDAAIYATNSLAPICESFAVMVLPTIAKRIHALETPPAVQLAFIAVLRHMHHNNTMAHEVKAICMKVPMTNF